MTNYLPVFNEGLYWRRMPQTAPEKAYGRENISLQWMRSGEWMVPFFFPESILNQVCKCYCRYLISSAIWKHICTTIQVSFRLLVNYAERYYKLWLAILSRKSPQFYPVPPASHFRLLNSRAVSSSIRRLISLKNRQILLLPPAATWYAFVLHSFRRTFRYVSFYSKADELTKCDCGARWGS